jgi:ribosomal protein S18 acetylase RimI-like enzyme
MKKREASLAKKRKRPNVAIRELEIDDLPAVFHLGEKLFTARDVPNLYRTWDEDELIDLFQGDPEFCLVAEMDEQIVGFALGATVIKSRSAWKYGHLSWFAVEPEWQRRGIATRLFNNIRDAMVDSGVRILIVDTQADNLPALRFFRNLGFGNPEEQIYLSLNLATPKRPTKDKNSGSRRHTPRSSSADV